MAQGTSEATSASPDVLQVQHQIRANASELQDYFADLYRWEKTISQEEEARKQTPSQQMAVPLPRGRKDVTVCSTPSPVPEAAAPAAITQEKRADAHTYDNGYKKWEKFDVDAALRDADDDHVQQSTVPAPVTKKTAPTAKKVMSAKTKGGSAATTTPTKSREELEKEDGNGHYKRGDYVAAIKSYTRALGFNARNVVVLSNRAMAYLKNKEYGKAEDDCSLAIKMDATHVKSYSRRGTARNALGKHRLALLDFERALELDPSNKQTASQVSATKELLRTAIKRAPKRTQFSIQVQDNPTDSTPVAVVPLPEKAPEDKENVPILSNNKITVVEEIVLSKPMEKVSEEPTPLRSSPPPAPPIEVARAVNTAPLPKLPKKAATSSYEFLRVWKTFAPKGDSARMQQLLQLRADYLRLLAPASLSSVFKNSIESELLCELFATIHQAMDITGGDREFIVSFVTELPRVPRFSMVIMFMSDKEKEDIARVLEALLKSEEQGSDLAVKLQALKPQYGLK